jgi:predicted transcriptional regulator YdeE
MTPQIVEANARKLVGRRQQMSLAENQIKTGELWSPRFQGSLQ